jgi:hypothetical protein
VDLTSASKHPLIFRGAPPGKNFENMNASPDKDFEILARKYNPIGKSQTKTSINNLIKPPEPPIRKIEFNVE